MGKLAIYTGTCVEKYAGNLDKNVIGTVLAIATAYCGTKIYKVLVGNEIKTWFGEFVRPVQATAVLHAA